MYHSFNVKILGIFHKLLFYTSTLPVIYRGSCLAVILFPLSVIDLIVSCDQCPFVYKGEFHNHFVRLQERRGHHLPDSLKTIKTVLRFAHTYIYLLLYNVHANRSSLYIIQRTSISMNFYYTTNFYLAISFFEITNIF